jgi:multidrug efflux pump subunit AcrB
MRNLNLSLLSVTNPAVTLFAILVALAAGALAYFNLGRAEDPTFTIKTMVVTAVWPGATAEEVQNLVAEPIEKRIQELPELDYVRTFSRPGAAVVQVQLKDSVREAQPVWYQIRKKVGDLSPSLPQGVIGPFFNDEYGEVFSAIYMVTGEGLGRAELKAYAEQLRTRLLAVEDAAKVALIGDVEERVWVEISHRRLATLGISPQTIFDAIGRQNGMTPAGAIQTEADEVQVRVSGGLGSLAALRDLPIPAGGSTLRLGDIAEIRRGYEEPASYLAFLEGRPAVGVGVAMAEGANVVELGKRLGAEVDAFRADLPLGVEVTQTADQADIVTHAFDEFIKTFIEALVIVLVVSFVTLGWRTGIVVALSVPIVLAIVFVIMQAWGMNFDRITLGALIIALGLLVDDAIIAVEMMVVKIEQGYDRIAAASAAWSSTAFPMLTGTLVTAAGFLPVGLAKSTSGEYAGNIFWVVGIALIVSWFVAVIVTPYLGLKLLPEPKPGAHHASHDSRLYRLLRSGVTASLRARWWVIGATVAALIATGVGMGFVQQQFFPSSARAELFIETRMPEGSSIEATAKAALAAEALVKGDPDVRFSSTYVGAGAPRFFFALNPALPNPSFAMTVIMAQDADARDRLRAKIEAAVAAGAVPEARIRVDQIVFGPPVGFPVQFRVIGPDPQEVRRIAADVRAAMVANPNTIEPQFDWNEQAKMLDVRLDQDRIRALGLNSADVSNTLQTLLTGVKVSEFRDGTELVDIIVRAPEGERADPSRLSDLTILLPSGAAVPLSQVAEVSYGFEEPILWRRNRDIALTVRADVVPGIQAPTVTAQLLPALAPIIDALPAGYRIETGGAVEESAKANVALFKVFPLMFLVMLSLLMLQLRSFSKLFLVFLTAPLGAIGAVAALLAFNAPFGFVALLGVIALAGMIMRNTVILVDQIDHDLAAGASPWDAIVESTVRRARPVVLTALAAILAMIPLARSVFWGPMAMAIMGGLIVATVLTLFFLPALYAAWFRVRATTPAPEPVTAPVALIQPLRIAGE